MEKTEKLIRAICMLIEENSSLPYRERIKGNQYRAYIFLKDNSWGGRCDLFLALHKDLNINYEGHFTVDFYDLSLLYDVYIAWCSRGALLDNLKKQVPKLNITYPNYSKNKVLFEGALAHNALFEYIRGSVENNDKK